MESLMFLARVEERRLRAWNLLPIRVRVLERDPAQHRGVFHRESP